MDQERKEKDTPADIIKRVAKNQIALSQTYLEITNTGGKALTLPELEWFFNQQMSITNDLVSVVYGQYHPEG